MNSVFCQATVDIPQILSLPDMKCLHIVSGALEINEIDYYVNDYAYRTQLDLSNIIGRYDVYRLDCSKQYDNKQYHVKDVYITNNAMKVKPNFILPGGDYLSITYHGNTFLSGPKVDILNEYAKKHHIPTTGDYFEFRIFDSYDTSLPEEYLSAVCIKTS